MSASTNSTALSVWTRFPYISSKIATAELDLFAQDAAGTANKPIGIDPGDRVTVDEYLSVTYQGDYEVLDVQATPDTVQNGTAQAGRVTLSLGPYSASNYVAYDPSEAGWANVPGSDLGSQDGGFTGIDLDDGGAGFYTGISASGTTIPVPGGFNTNTFMG